MIEFDRLTFSYGGSETPALDEILAQIQEGQFVLLTGLSGSGKSTLLRAMNGLVPHFYGGRYTGDVTINGTSVKAASVAEMGSMVGLIFQDSSAQLVAETVDKEIAFGPSNLGLSEREIESRIVRAAKMMGIEHLLGRRTATLSGGEKQKTAIAAVLSMSPDVLILDEPFAELDNASVVDLLALLVKLNKTEDMTVIIAEHRIEKVLEIADKALVIENGRLREEQKPVIPRSHTTNARDDEESNEEPIKIPRVARNDKSKKTGNYKSKKTGNYKSKKTGNDKSKNTRRDIINIQDLSFSYNGRSVLEEFDLSVAEGEAVALAGPNGCGKTTLLRLICGFLSPEAGKIFVAGLRVGQADRTELFREIGYVPQRPSALLFAESVEEEIFGAGRHDKTEQHDRYSSSESRCGESRGGGLLEEFGLSDTRERYPRDLSWGQQQRVALAAVMIKEPSVLLLDEPTHGLDAGAKRDLASLLKDMTRRGTTIVIATHDEEMAEMVADKTVRLVYGEKSR